MPPARSFRVRQQTRRSPGTGKAAVDQFHAAGCPLPTREQGAPGGRSVPGPEVGMTVGMLSPVGSERGVQQTGRAFWQSELTGTYSGPWGLRCRKLSGPGHPSMPRPYVPLPCAASRGLDKAPNAIPPADHAPREMEGHPPTHSAMASMGHGNPSGATHLGDPQVHRDFFQRPPQR